MKGLFPDSPQIPNFLTELLQIVKKSVMQCKDISENKILQIFYDKFKCILLDAINATKSQLAQGYDKQLEEKLSLLKNKLREIQEIENHVFRSKAIMEKLKHRDRVISDAQKQLRNHFDNTNFYYEICQQCDFPDQNLSKIILKLK